MGKTYVHLLVPLQLQLYVMSKEIDVAQRLFEGVMRMDMKIN